MILEYFEHNSGVLIPNIESVLPDWFNVFFFLNYKCPIFKNSVDIDFSHVLYPFVVKLLFRCLII